MEVPAIGQKRDGNMRRKSKVTTKLQWKLGAATTAVTGSVTILYEVVRREFTINEKRKKKKKEIGRTKLIQRVRMFETVSFK